jgi:hypothetical protein
MTLNDIMKSVTDAIGRIADTFAEMETEEPQRCAICGSRSRSGRHSRREHDGEFTTRH